MTILLLKRITFLVNRSIALEKSFVRKQQNFPKCTKSCALKFPFFFSKEIAISNFLTRDLFFPSEKHLLICQTGIKIIKKIERYGMI